MFMTVQVRNVFGNDLVYPIDQTAIQFADLLNVKSFNRAQVSKIKRLGYEVRVAAGQLPWTLV